MKKLIFIISFLISISTIFAQLETNIPFDTTVVGQAWNETNYTFQSDYFYVTNTGETTDFTINVSSINLPEGWNLMWCHEIQGEGGCNFNPSLTLEFPQNVEVQLDFILAPVASAESCDIEFEFVSESLPEPETITFHFRTADASNADDMSLMQPQMELSQNYPNPFNPNTTIGFSLPDADFVNLTIYNSVGQKVATLLNETKNSGIYQLEWNGKNDSGKSVASGTYFYQLRNSKYVVNKKMILMK
jgi:hypothetical protein